MEYPYIAMVHGMEDPGTGAVLVYDVATPTVVATLSGNTNFEVTVVSDQIFPYKTIPGTVFVEYSQGGSDHMGRMNSRYLMKINKPVATGAANTVVAEIDPLQITPEALAAMTDEERDILAYNAHLLSPEDQAKVLEATLASKTPEVTTEIARQLDIEISEDLKEIPVPVPLQPAAGGSLLLPAAALGLLLIMR